MICEQAGNLILEARKLTIACEELHYFCEVDGVDLTKVRGKGKQLVEFHICGVNRQIKVNYCRISALILLAWCFCIR